VSHQIELTQPPPKKNIVVKRKIRENTSTWWVNGVASTERLVKETSKKLNIAVDNLCQFLAQDRVSEFAKMSPQQLLVATQEAVGGEEMVTPHPGFAVRAVARDTTARGVRMPRARERARARPVCASEAEAEGAGHVAVERVACPGGNVGRGPGQPRDRRLCGDAWRGSMAWQRCTDESVTKWPRQPPDAKPLKSQAICRAERRLLRIALCTKRARGAGAAADRAHPAGQGPAGPRPHRAR
jgi:hypothetical protein